MKLWSNSNFVYEKNQAFQKREKAYSAGESSHEAGGLGCEREREANFRTL